MFEVFKNVVICKLYSVNIIKSDVEFDQETILIETDDNNYYQIISDGDISLIKLASLNNPILIGEYDMNNERIELVLLKEIESKEINKIVSYWHGEYYQFGMEFLDEDTNFIFGLSFGFDAVKLLSETEFLNMLQLYENYSVLNH
jgi:hypothetical protein